MANAKATCLVSKEKWSVTKNYPVISDSDWSEISNICGFDLLPAQKRNLEYFIRQSFQFRFHVETNNVELGQCLVDHVNLDSSTFQIDISPPSGDIKATFDFLISCNDEDISKYYLKSDRVTVSIINNAFLGIYNKSGYDNIYRISPAQLRYCVIIAKHFFKDEKSGGRTNHCINYFYFRVFIVWANLGRNDFDIRGDDDYEEKASAFVLFTQKLYSLIVKKVGISSVTKMLREAHTAATKYIEHRALSTEH